MASRDVAAFPREERHQREPVGTRFEEALDEQAEQKEERGRVCFGTLFFRTRSEISRDYPLNLSISLSGGKETNQDSPSNGE